MSEKDDVTPTLRGLPRVRVSEDFTQRVMAEVHAAKAREQGFVPRRRPPVMGVALAAAVVMGLGVSWIAVDRAEQPEAVPAESVRAAVELAALRAEMEAIQRDIDDLRQRPSRRLIAVPGDMREDVLVDFRPAGFQGGSSLIRPARFERLMEVSP